MRQAQGQNRKPAIYIPAILQKGLNSIKDYPLAILCADSGFGKTTAMNEYLHRVGARQICWHTCMGEPLGKAWSSVCKSLSLVDVKLARQLETLGLPIEENLLEVVDILNGLETNDDVWFVIDNFQYIQTELPQNTLWMLGQHKCPWLHIVIITQSMANIAINGAHPDKIYLLKNDCFFFQKEDMNFYFKHNGIPLSAEELDKLQMLSEGWIAVLNLQLISYLQTGDFETADSMETLIRTVIWNPLKTKERLALISLSLLNRFTTRQAHIILQENSFPSWFTGLLNNGAFIRYEKETARYTLHSLLKNFLLQELATLPIEEIHRLRKLAADAYAVEGQRYYALCEYLAAEDWEALLSLPYRASDFSMHLEEGSGKKLEAVLKNGAPSLLMKHPKTLSMITFELFRAGNYRAFDEGCALMEKILEQPRQRAADREEFRVLEGQLALLQSFSAFNNIEKMSALHRKAWEILGGPFSNRKDWNDSWTFGQTSILYLFWHSSGKLENALACMDECLPYYTRLTEGHGTGANFVMRAEALLMEGADDEAEMLCHKALYLANAQEQDSICFAAEMTLLRLFLLRGDVDSYESVKQSILKRGQNCAEPAGRKMADLALSFVSVLFDVNTVTNWITDLERVFANLYKTAIPFGVLTHLRWLLHGNQDAKLLGIADGALLMAEEQHFLLPQVYFHLLASIVYLRRGEKFSATKFLDKALSLALPDKIYLPFAEYGDHLRPVLSERLKNPEREILLSLCARQAKGVEKLKLGSNLNCLTSREREVARLAAAGFTNREIAARLFVSVETVKTIMKGLFKKLDIASRVQLKNLKEIGKI